MCVVVKHVNKKSFLDLGQSAIFFNLAIAFDCRLHYHGKWQTVAKAARNETNSCTIENPAFYKEQRKKKFWDLFQLGF